NRFGCRLTSWQAERLPCRIFALDETCGELFERKFELPKQPHIRARPWSASRFARVHRLHRRFVLQSSICPAKNEWLILHVPLAIPWQAKHATLLLSQPCRPNRSTRKRLPNPAPSASFPNQRR